MLAFLGWFQSIKVRSVPKAGVMYNLSRDYHEANFTHLLDNNVPIHYPWSAKEKNEPSFLRLSPEYWNEYLVLKQRAGDNTVDLERFAELRALASGPRALWLPHWEYHIVDFCLWGAHSITHWNIIRAYAECFKGVMSESPTGPVYTFFRQSPLRADESAFDREWPRGHEHELTDFATQAIGEEIVEGEAFFEWTSVVREQAKNKWAPRTGRTFNSFNGGHNGVPLSHSRVNVRLNANNEFVSPSDPGYMEASAGMSLAERLGPPVIKVLTPPMSPTRRSSSTGDLGLETRWSRQMAKGSGRHSTSTSSSRTYDSANFRGEFQDLVGEPGKIADVSAAAGLSEWNVDEQATASSWRTDSAVAANLEPADVPSESSLAVVSGFHAPFESREQAVHVIQAYAPRITELEPLVGLYEGSNWNAEWINKSILVCSDARSLVHMKTYAACDDSIDKIEQVLDFALRFGLPFVIYTKMSDVRAFADRDVSALSKSTLDALYSPGYVDHPLAMNGQGGMALYEQYCRHLNNLLVCPHTVAFIGRGGILRFIAEYYNESLVDQFVQGPSQQGRHSTPRTNRPSKDAMLWPSQAIMESECSHMRGYISTGILWIFWNLKEDNLNENFAWRTRAEWKEYFRAGNRGTHTPSVMPSKEDFDAGNKLFDRCFPINWANMHLADTVLPEVFEPTRAEIGEAL
ncbi:hypothetical protein DFH09DRAFT_1302023 [Mycena vulgaris]|nr:hypothetical protein DFH09DRAFT_1302023 [Mycena vulgaris]